MSKLPKHTGTWPQLGNNPLLGKTCVFLAGPSGKAGRDDPSVFGRAVGTITKTLRPGVHQNKPSIQRTDTKCLSQLICLRRKSWISAVMILLSPPASLEASWVLLGPSGLQTKPKRELHILPQCQLISEPSLSSSSCGQSRTVAQSMRSGAPELTPRARRRGVADQHLSAGNTGAISKDSSAFALFSTSFRLAGAYQTDSIVPTSYVTEMVVMVVVTLGTHLYIRRCPSFGRSGPHACEKHFAKQLCVGVVLYVDLSEGQTLVAFLRRDLVSGAQVRRDEVSSSP
jgi:hypothetical protein